MFYYIFTMQNTDEESNNSDCSMRVKKPSFFQKKLGKSVYEYFIL